MSKGAPAHVSVPKNDCNNYVSTCKCLISGSYSSLGVHTDPDCDLNIAHEDSIALIPERIEKSHVLESCIREVMY